MPAWPGAGPYPTPPPAAAGRRSGGRLTVAAVIALIALLVAGGLVAVRARQGGDPAAEAPAPTHPDTWDARVEPIADWLEGERDLDFEHPVEVVFQTEEEYLAAAEVGPDDDEDEEAAREAEEDADATVAVLRALGLVDGEVDLETAASDLAGKGTLAYYSPVEETVYVRGTELTPGVRVTLAHELTHVLQDQHFDLERVGDPDFDRAEVLRAVAEGDAGRMEAAFVDEELTEDEALEHAAEEESGSTEARATLDETVPSALLTLQAAPYALGETYVAFLDADEGAWGIDSALTDPPSEEELLDPRVRDTWAAEPAEVDQEAPEGAEVIDDSTIGPLGWYLLLASRGDPKAALRAVDGWAGDHYVAYERDGEVCASATVVGDGEGATDRLGMAISAWAAQAPGGGASVEKVDGEIRVQACDPGAAAGSAGAVTDDLLLLPIVRTQIWMGLREGGATSTQADCATDRLIESFSVAELTDPNAAADPAVQQRIQSTTSGCA